MVFGDDSLQLATLLSPKHFLSPAHESQVSLIPFIVMSAQDRIVFSHVVSNLIEVLKSLKMIDRDGAEMVCGAETVTSTKLNALTSRMVTVAHASTIAHVVTIANVSCGRERTRNGRQLAGGRESSVGSWPSRGICM
jgi:hypothetical protein